MEPQTFWHRMSETSRTRLIVGIVMAVAIIVAVTVYLVVNRPWESRQYKECVRVGQEQLPSDVSKSQVQTYCHQLYG